MQQYSIQGERVDSYNWNTNLGEKTLTVIVVSFNNKK